MDSILLTMSPPRTHPIIIQINTMKAIRLYSSVNLRPIAWYQAFETHSVPGIAHFYILCLSTMNAHITPRRVTVSAAYAVAVLSSFSSTFFKKPSKGATHSFRTGTWWPPGCTITSGSTKRSAKSLHLGSSTTVSMLPKK